MNNQVRDTLRAITARRWLSLTSGSGAAQSQTAPGMRVYREHIRRAGWVIIYLSAVLGWVSTSLGELAGNPSVVESPDWGRLSFERALLEAPLENIKRMDMPDTGNPWNFVMMTQPQVEAFLIESGLDRQRVSTLMLTALEDLRIWGLVLNPSPDQIRSLSPVIRAKIYLNLARHPRNFDQQQAFHFAGDSVAQWLEGLNLRKSTVLLVERYAYHDGVFWLVADLKLIRKELNDEIEYERLLQGLHRELSWRVWLDVSEDEDVSELTRYWGRGGREAETGRLLKELAQKPGGGRVEISRLMPVFPRQILNTYPSGELYPRRDCHWFSMNF
ncbi:MAG: hypothetical protein ACYTGQ_11965, partial [Planctomycetota bacterium]